MTAIFRTIGGYVDLITDRDRKPIVDTKALIDAKYKLKQPIHFYNVDVKWIKKNPKLFTIDSLIKWRDIILDKDIPIIRQTFKNVDGYTNYDKDGYIIGSSYCYLDSAAWKDTKKWILDNPRPFTSNDLIKYRDIILDKEIPPVRRCYNFKKTSIHYKTSKTFKKVIVQLGYLVTISCVGSGIYYLVSKKNN